MDVLTDPESSQDEILRDCAIVMAHPDDEILWASSLMTRASRIILCYGEQHPPFIGRHNNAIGEGRRQMAKTFPMDTVSFLLVPEAGVMNRAGWPNPKGASDGLLVEKPIFGTSAGRERYSASFQMICNELRHRLKGIREVVTHNPWGEYGHEDHVQVFRAVCKIQAELGYSVWVSGYIAPKAIPLMQKEWVTLGPPTPPLSTNLPLASELVDYYKKHDCWTWYHHYKWPDCERFFPLRSDQTEPISDCHYQLNIIGDVEVKSIPSRAVSKVIRTVKKYRGT